MLTTPAANHLRVLRFSRRRRHRRRAAWCNSRPRYRRTDRPRRSRPAGRPGVGVRTWLALLLLFLALVLLGHFRFAQPPLRREFGVVVLDGVVEATVHRGPEFEVVRIMLCATAHRFEHARQQATQVLALELLH